ncbi:MAG: sulfotransferase [Prolixibacteraceae bacterium]|nr:sulfotransferase [Prolixibacteraceae bacterium]
MTKKYLFIGGCARSGTSALTKLIGKHHDVVLGMERYNKLCHKMTYSLTKEHFEKERFFNIEKGDTFYNDFDQMHKYDSDIYHKFDNCKYIGLKYPKIHTILDEIKTTFNDIKIIFIYRNIFDVANSWNQRAIIGKNWSKERDYKKAVITWNRSMRVIRRAINNGYPIICMNYDDVFYSDKSLKPLYDLLDIENDEKTISNMRERAQIIKTNKKMILNKEEIEYVEENADVGIYEIFNQKFNMLRSTKI